MHYIPSIWEMREANPIATLMFREDRIPDHIRETMTQVPEGYHDRPRDHLRRPDAGDMFITHVPRNRDDVDCYLTSLQHPYTTKLSFIRRVAGAPLPLVGHILDLITINTFAMITCAYFTWGNTAYHTVTLVTQYVMFALYMITGNVITYIFTVLSAKKYLNTHYPADAPTALMKDIEARSIDISNIDPSLAALAWDIYCHDPVRYNELARLIQRMQDDPDARSTKTWDMYTDAIDTFRRAAAIKRNTHVHQTQERYTHHGIFHCDFKN